MVFRVSWLVELIRKGLYLKRLRFALLHSWCWKVPVQASQQETFGQELRGSQGFRF